MDSSPRSHLLRFPSYLLSHAILFFLFFLPPLVFQQLGDMQGKKWMNTHQTRHTPLALQSKQTNQLPLNPKGVNGIRINLA
ncbi:hypothetical protein HanRHA438_Chr12g0555721 [Helianthus annuus]|nr:hypothetical protein HanRHA438_Chr12g0555721 [Helianthus annuus]